MRLGIDESGTGAWAGPFYVVGVLVEDEEDFARKCGGLRDSKKLSDAKRRALVPRIRENALGIYVFAGTVEAMKSDGMRVTWRRGIASCLLHFRPQLPEVVVDGPRDKNVPVPSGLRVIWESKADDRYPSVMAASILAKTERNDVMNALARDFPLYGWEKNAGYGSKDHIRAISQYGTTPHHREIRRTSPVEVSINLLGGNEE